jgi:GTP-binding protein
VLPEDEVDAYCDDIVKRIGWTGRVFRISGLSHAGTDELTQEAMRYLETLVINPEISEGE